MEAERLARSNTAPGAVVTGSMSIPEDYGQCRDWLLRCVSQLTAGASGHLDHGVSESRGFALAPHQQPCMLSNRGLDGG